MNQLFLVLSFSLLVMGGLDEAQSRPDVYGDYNSNTHIGLLNIKTVSGKYMNISANENGVVIQFCEDWGTDLVGRDLPLVCSGKYLTDNEIIEVINKEISLYRENNYSSEFYGILNQVVENIIESSDEGLDSQGQPSILDKIKKFSLTGI